MRLLDVEYLFGGEKILFYYVAPERVDFRELVRILAHKYHTRIEMRQLGVRDAARLVLDFSHCGEELCCRRFLKEFKPVSVRTARLQKTTLDPSKISGACGRLMCCLLYEDFLYAELKKNIPEREEKVRTERGEAVVIGYNIIEQTVTVQYEGGERETLPASQIVRIAPLQPEKEEELRFD
jgi:cell fate regulator YaaT (PSP1 superfamily)